MKDSARRYELIGRWFISAWALLAAPTIGSVLIRGLHPASLAVAFGFLFFMAVWVWFWLRGLGNRQAAIVAAVAVTVTLSLYGFLGPPNASLLVFTCAIVGAAFPFRYAAWALVALSVLQAGLSALRLLDPASTFNIVVNNILVGLVCAGARVFWYRYLELLAAREEIARLAVSEERLRFARDLHDLLGQSLAVVVLKSELAVKQLPENADDSIRQELRDVVRVARKSLNDVREAVAGYRRPTLSAELSNARTALRAAGIALRVEDRLGRVPPDADGILAWCLREAVTNVVKHSGARNCTVRLERDGEAALLAVADDGRGADSIEGGSGLAGLRERVELGGGTVEIEPSGGFRVRVRVPAGQPAPSELAVT